MKRKASSAKLLDKTIWNPRPVIDLLSRAVFESGVSFLHFLGPAFSGRFTFYEQWTFYGGCRCCIIVLLINVILAPCDLACTNSQQPEPRPERPLSSFAPSFVPPPLLRPSLLLLCYSTPINTFGMPQRCWCWVLTALRPHGPFRSSWCFLHPPCDLRMAPLVSLSTPPRVLRCPWFSVARGRCSPLSWCGVMAPSVRCLY
jgi:hypothetical protein